MLVDIDKPLTWLDFCPRFDKEKCVELTMEQLKELPQMFNHNADGKENWREPFFQDVKWAKTGYWHWVQTYGPYYYAEFVEFAGMGATKEYDMGGSYTEINTNKYQILINGRPLIGRGKLPE